MLLRLAAIMGVALASIPALAADTPAKPRSGDVTLANFRYDRGETLSALKLHYITLGTPTRDAAGKITNAVLLLHGTTCTADAFLQPPFFDALYGSGEPPGIESVVLPAGPRIYCHETLAHPEIWGPLLESFLKRPSPRR